MKLRNFAPNSALMRRAIFLLCFLEMACAHRYVISLADQSERECETLSLAGDSLLCRSQHQTATLALDSVLHIQRQPRLAGTLVLGGLGATAGVFVGAIFGAMWAWSHQASSPELYALVPIVAGGALGFFAGKALWTLLDKKTLHLRHVPPDRRKQELQNFIK